MQDVDDIALLREYAVAKSESAFAALVSRHIHFVYSAALRQVRDPDLAKDVTQAVFIILARKAGKISSNVVLSGWLFKTVRFTASAQLKAAMRRQRREQEANMNSLISQPASNCDWDRMAPLLDEAIAKLSEKDRQALLLRYFEGKSLAQVGGALAVNEDAARKRVGRALDKLRQFFGRRGVALSVVAIGGALTTCAVQAAPAGLATTISATAVQGSAAAASTLALAKGALKLMTLAKVKVIGLATAAAVVVVATGVAVEKLATESKVDSSPAQVTIEGPAPASPDQAASTSTVVSAASAPAPVAQQQIKTRPNPGPAGGVDDSVWTQMDGRPLSALPAEFILRPTHFDGRTSKWVATAPSADGQRMLARAISFKRLLAAAYRVPFSRVLFVDGMPEQRVDVLMAVPGGSMEMLQEEIRKQFGLVAAREMRDGDVLAVTVKNAQAPGLKPSDPGQEQSLPGAAGAGGAGFGTRLSFRQENGSGGSVQSVATSGNNNFSAHGLTIENLIQNLQSYFDETLYDETGLTGNYDVSLEWAPSGDKAAASDALKAAVLNQLGLDLVPGRAQVEMLVVRKAQ